MTVFRLTVACWAMAGAGLVVLAGIGLWSFAGWLADRRDVRADMASLDDDLPRLYDDWGGDAA